VLAFDPAGSVLQRISEDEDGRRFTTPTGIAIDPKARINLGIRHRLVKTEEFSDPDYVRNDGALPGLPDDAVVEVPARIDADGAHPLAQEPLAPELLGLVQQAKAYERLAVEAAVTGDRTVALKALLANPLVREYRVAAPLLDALLQASRPYLPRFFPG